METYEWTGDLNPADDLSRGLSAEALLSSDRWIKRPAFLWEQKQRWLKGPFSLGSVPDADPEVKLDVNVHATAVAVPFCLVVEYFRRTSSWHRLKKSTAWFLRYHENLRFASTHKKIAISCPNAPWRHINMEEVKAAELRILKCVQLHYFPEKLQSLTKAGVDVAHVKKTSGLRSLNPVLVDGLLRIGGRFGLTPACFDSKHQIILPKSDHVSTLIIEHCDLASGHSGREYVLSLLHEKFWIIRAHSAVRRVLSTLVKQGPGSRRESRRHLNKILAAGIFIPGGIPARFSPGSENSRRPKSRQDPAANLAKILAGKQKSRWPKSRWDPGANPAEILAGKQKFGQPKSRWDPAVNLAEILTGRQIPGGQNLAVIANANLDKILAERQIPGGQNLDVITNANLDKILTEKQIPGEQNLDAILLGISPNFAAGSEILGKIHCGNLGKILAYCHEFLLEQKSFKQRLKLPSVYMLESSLNTDKTNLKKRTHIAVRRFDLMLLNVIPLK